MGGPLLDRIDIHVEVAAVAYQELAASEAGTSSQSIREQVLSAQDVQEQRFGGGRGRRNSQMTSRELRKHCPLDAAGRAHLKTNVQELGLSARAHDKVLRVARTIADLEGSPDISCAHVAEAVNYRLLDRQMWT